MPLVPASNKTVPRSVAATPASATHRGSVANQHSGSFLNPPPQHLYIHLRPEDAGGRGGATSAALEQGDATVHAAGDVVVGLILVVIVVFISFMATFFWRKYRKISILRNAHAYEYSQLSQCERDAADLTEILDDLGVSINTSTDEEVPRRGVSAPRAVGVSNGVRHYTLLSVRHDSHHKITVNPKQEEPWPLQDLEPACPATISVTSSYISPHTAITATNNNNNINNKDADDIGKINSNNAVNNNHVLSSNHIQPDLVTASPPDPFGEPSAATITTASTNSTATAAAAPPLIHSPVPLHPHMPPPLLPEVTAPAAGADEATAAVLLTHFTDSDEELLQ